MSQLLSVEFLKIKRRGIWLLIFLGPFGVVALQAVNWGIRYDWLTAQHTGNLWAALLQNVGSLGVPALIIGSTIITSMLANMEHQSRSWKQWFALPVSKSKFYVSKVMTSLILLVVSTILLSEGAVILGVCLKFGTKIPINDVIRYCALPTVAALPIILMQLWLSVRFTTQSLAISRGVLGTVISLWSFIAPKWLPWVWPFLVSPWGEMETLLLATVVGFLVGVVSLVDFVNKEVGSS